jgi:hypothetical protein
MGDALEPLVPDILWKYRKWDDDCDKAKGREFARNMIVYGELYYATKEQLNDPMDMHWRERYPSEPGEQFRFARAFLAANGLENHSDVRLQLESICNIIRAQQIYNNDAIDGIIGTRIKIELGVLCLSKISDDFLMWSHYAAGHSGICVGIRTAAVRGRFRKCLYEEVPGFLDAWDFINHRQDLFIQASRTKAKRWEYEQEWRSLSMPPGPRRIPGCVDSLIFGATTDEKIREEVLAAVSESGQPIKLFQAVRHPTRYELDIVPFAE